MKAVDQKLTKVESPVTLTTITSHFLVRILSAAISRTSIGKPRPGAVPPPFNAPLHLNVPQARKYGVCEFTLSPEDKYTGELQNVFEFAFEAKEAKTVFDELQVLLPDGVMLSFTYAKASSFPRYESEGRLVLLSIYLAARHYIADKHLPPEDEKRAAEKLHDIWGEAAAYIETLYPKYRLTDITSANTLFTKIKEAVDEFQDQCRAELVAIHCKGSPPQHSDLQEIAAQLSQYEQKPHLNISPDLVELEREFNCDLFRGDADGRFQFYKRHLPLTHQQKKRPIKANGDEKSQALFCSPLSSSSTSSSSSLPLPTLTPSSPSPLPPGDEADDRILYPTITAHGDGSSLPNFAEVCEGTFDANSSKFVVAFCSARHGTPMSLQELADTKEDAPQKHINIYQVFLNYEQELLIIRARAIESSLLKFNASASNKRKISSLSDIQRFSLAFSAKIAELMHDKLLTANFDKPADNLKLFKDAFDQVTKPFASIEKQVYYFLASNFSSLLFVKNFYTHIISGHDVVHATPERTQFRTCDLAQFAWDYSPENSGFIYFCAPLNAPKVATFAPLILNSIRSALIEAFFAYNTAFPENKVLESKTIAPLFKLYSSHRTALANAVKTYIQSCAPGQKKTIVELNGLQASCNTAESAFYETLKDPFATLHEAIIKSKPSTAAGIILKVIFQIFENGSSSGSWCGDHKGMLPVLFHLLTHAINSSGKIAISASGGCKSAHDRWQKLALMLTRMVNVEITNTLLADLDTVLKNYADDLAFNLSGSQTARDRCTKPKTKLDKLEKGFTKFDKDLYPLYLEFEDLAPHKRQKSKLPDWNTFKLRCTSKNPSYNIWIQFKPSSILAPLTQAFYDYCIDETEPSDSNQALSKQTRVVSAMRTYRLETSSTEKKQTEATDSLAILWLSEYFNRKQLLEKLSMASAVESLTSPHLVVTEEKENEPDLDGLLSISQQYLDKSNGNLKRILGEIKESPTTKEKYTILFKLVDECFRIQIALKRPSPRLAGFFGKGFAPEEIKYSQHMVTISFATDSNSLSIVSMQIRLLHTPSSLPDPTHSSASIHPVESLHQDEGMDKLAGLLSGDGEDEGDTEEWFNVHTKIEPSSSFMKMR